MRFRECRPLTQHYSERTRDSPPSTQVRVSTLPIGISRGGWSALAEEHGSKNLIFGMFWGNVACAAPAAGNSRGPRGHFFEYRLFPQHYPERTRGSPPTTQVGVYTLPIPMVGGRWSALAD